MEDDSATRLHLREEIPLANDSTSQTQRNRRLGRKAKRRVTDISDNLLVDLRDAPGNLAPDHIGSSLPKATKIFRATKVKRQTTAFSDSNLPAADAAKRKWANCDVSTTQRLQISPKPSQLKDVPLDPQQSASHLSRSLHVTEPPGDDESKKSKREPKRNKSRRASKMSSAWVPPHLRGKPELVATQHVPDIVSLPSNVELNGRDESSPPFRANIKECMTPGQVAPKLARSSAIQGKQPTVKHVRIDDAGQNNQSSISHSTADNTPNSTPDGLATSGSSQSTPTGATALTQQAQSPCPRKPTTPPGTNAIPPENAESEQPKHTKALVVARHKGNNSHRQKQVSGWLTKEERKAMRPKEDNNDSAHDGGADDNWDSNNVQNLVDWEGNWLPAPVEWEVRRGFKRHNYFENIADWIDDANHTTVHMPTEKNEFVYVPKKIIPLSRLLASASEQIAPRVWIPIEVDNQTLQTFWRSLQTSDLKLVDEEDAGTIPFWQLYRSNDSEYLIPLEVPDAQLDPADEEECKGMYRKGKNDENTANEQIKKREREAKMTEQQRKACLRNERRRLRELRATPVILPPPDPNRPKVNIYLRPASLDDAHQMVRLYNWYVQNTCHVSEMLPVSVREMQGRLDFIERHGLPSILAILKANEKPARGTRPTLHTTMETVVGFAYAEDHEGRDRLHRYCAEVEVYVDQEYLGKGVGKSLLDRMMWLLDPQYRCRDLVEWRVDQDDVAWNTAGGRRVINTLFANATFNSKDKARIIWITRWLEQFGFVKKAELDDCGIKLGHSSTKAIFQAKTGANVDPRTAIGVTPA